MIHAALEGGSSNGRALGCGCGVAALVVVGGALVAVVAAFAVSASPLGWVGLAIAAPGSAGDLVAPLMCPGLQVSQGFGDTPFEHPHTGIDLVCPAGTPVRAVIGGIFYAEDGGAVPCVFPSGARGGLGHYGEIDANGVEYLYGHLQSFAVPSGTPVPAGTVIGFEGSSGCSTGFHLHFEVRVRARAINPCSFLPQGYPATHESAANRCWGSAPP